jgi:IS1 family transposase
LAFIAAFTFVFIERSKARKLEDIRMSKGLQLLTSKASILQDLIDRTETQGKQITQLIDRKQGEVRERLEEVEIYLNKIQPSLCLYHNYRIFQTEG